MMNIQSTDGTSAGFNMTVLSIYRLFRSRVAHFLVLGSFFGALFFSQHAQAQELNFRVWAGEREIGTHTFKVASQGDKTSVLSNAIYKVKIMFVNVFSYEHTANEVWDGDCLDSLTSQTVEDGQKTTVDARRVENLFAVIRDEQPLLETEDCVGSYAYWDKQRIQRSALMNAQTGEIDSVSVTELGAQPLPRIEASAQAIQLDSDIASIRLWYDDSGKWLALQTQAEDRPVLYLNETLL
jgi:hypothetical protein